MIVAYVRWPSDYWDLNCMRGRALVWNARQPMTSRPQGWQLRTGPPPEPDGRDGEGVWRGLGLIVTVAGGPAGTYRHRSVAVPFWPVALAAAALPTRWLKRSLMSRRACWRARAGLCPA